MFADRTRRLTIFSIPILMLCAGFAGGATAAGPKALFTTGPQGQEVNANTFSSRFEVYINGGPRGAKTRGAVRGAKSARGEELRGGPQSPGGLAPGDYVFQVTDPSGGVLLSADPAGCRQFRVEDGSIIALRDLMTGGIVDHAGGSDGCHVEDSPEGAAGSSGRHDTNRQIDGAGWVIQLMPFVASPNGGQVYKAWVVPLDSYLARGGDLTREPQSVPDGFAPDPGFSGAQHAKTDNFKVIETDGEDNRPPVADAGPDQTVAAGATVNLNGSGSNDADGDPLTYAWSIDSAPAGSAASLHAADSVMPQLDTDLQGTYVVSLIVNDGTVDSVPDEVAITTGNSPPVADAGTDHSIVLFDAAYLDGSGSTDVDGDPLAYQWSVISAPPGSQYFFDDPTLVMPLFVPINAGSYVVELIVNDGQTDSAPDTVIVSTQNNRPVASAGRDQSATIGMTVTLDGSASFDLDGDALTFSWSLSAVPAGSAAVLSDPTAVMPQLDVDVDGTYVAQLIVNDGALDSNPDTVTLTATNLAPLADAGPDQTVDTGDTVTLDGSGSSDPELFPLAWSWSLPSAPVGSTAILANPTAVMPTFLADLPGDYVAQLIVHDGLLASPPDTVIISTANVPPVAEAGRDETLTAGDSIQLDGTGSTDADGDPLTYAWSFTSKPLGSVATLDDPTAAQPAFLLESVGVYVLQLIVHDGAAYSASDSVVIESLPTDRVLLLPDSDLVGLGRMVPGTVRLLSPPPPGGVTVTLSSNDEATASIAPATVMIPDGEDSARVSIHGLALGDTVLRADAPNYASGVAAVTVTDFLISLEQALKLAPGQTSSLAVSLSSPAPFGGQTVFLSSADPGIATITPSVFVPEGSQIPAANPQVAGGAIGMVDIIGTTSGYAPDASRVTVTIDISFYPSGLPLPLETREATLHLSAPAPAGLSFDLSIDDPAIASVPATITPVAGTTSVQVPVTGLAEGQTTLRASAPGISEATASINVDAGISLWGYMGVFVGDDLRREVRVDLASPAPPMGRTVVVTSTDPSRLLLSASASDPGSATQSVFVAGGDSRTTIWLHGLAAGGAVEVTTSAPAHIDGSDMVGLYPSGFVFETSSFATTTLVPDVPVIIGVRALDPVGLIPIWTGLDNTFVRDGLNITLNLASSDPAVGTLVGTPLTFTGGDSRLALDFIPAGAGQTTLSMATPAGFDTPASLATIDATVSTPPLRIDGESRVGYQLQERLRVTLLTPSPPPVDLTITVDDPSIILVSADDQTIGAASIVLPTAPSYTPGFFLQGLAPGTATLTVQAPGFLPATELIEVVPSGFRLSLGASPTFNTLMSNLPVFIKAEVINSRLPLSTRVRSLRPGYTIDVPVISTDPAVVAVIGSPVAAGVPSAPQQVELDILNAGVTTIQIVQPPGFSTPAGRSQSLVTVTSPGIEVIPDDGSNLSVGRDLQRLSVFNLLATPPAPIDVTITVDSAAIATVTGDPALDGSDTLMITGVTSSGQFSLQGRTLGITTLTVSAPGFQATTRTVEVTPAGFRFNGPSSLTMSTFDSNRTLEILPVALDPVNLQVIGDQPLRPGVSAQVEVVSSDPSVAAITQSPLSFSAGARKRTTLLDPLTAGSTTISLVTPAGFDTPSNFNQVAVTVTAPDVRLEAFGTVGLDLQTNIKVTLSVTPPGPVDVTITSLAPSIGILSDDPNAVGGSSVTFTGVTGPFVGFVRFQAVGLGSTQVVAQAAGYNDGTKGFGVVPSGFVHTSTLDVTTSVAANNVPHHVQAVPLDPTTLEEFPVPRGFSQVLRAGMTATVTVSSADPGVAAVALLPISVNGNQGSAGYEIDPIAVGSTVFTVDPVAGFTTPANNRDLLVIVDP